MTTTSLTKNAYISISKISLVYTIILTILVGTTSFFYFKHSKSKEIIKQIRSITNTFNRNTLEKNYPAILKDIQQGTHVQELLIYDKECNLITSSSLSTSSNICKSISSEFQKINLLVNSIPISVFYKLNFTFKAFVVINSHNFLLLFAILYIFTSFILISFLRSTLLKPLDQFKNDILSNNQLGSPSEFKFITEKLQEMRQQILKIEHERAYFQLARKVVHDIRNPLLFLKIMAEKESANDYLLTSILEIDYQINNLLSPKTRNTKEINLLKFLQNVEAEIETMFGLKVSIQDNIPNFYNLKINEFDLKNIFTNLARNSSEANAVILEVSAIQLQQYVEILISDDGNGISSSLHHQIFTRGFTTKKTGNGIGLSSLKNTLEELGGDIEILSKPSKGTLFSIKIPNGSQISQNAVFIDDDKFMHIAWKNSAIERGINLKTFFTIDEFLSQCDSFALNTSIYIDSDLGNGSKGEILSEKIFMQGFHNIYLATSYTDIETDNYPWISSSVSKRPPF